MRVYVLQTNRRVRNMNRVERRDREPEEEFMLSQRVFSNRALAWVAGVGLATLLSAPSATAQNNGLDYIVLIASGFLCDSGDSSSCPAVVKSADGSSYEMSGVGTFNTKGKMITAAGTFTHRSPNGNSLATGAWIANELVSFDSYGIALGARMQAGSVFGAPQFGPRRMPMLSGPMPVGGLAEMRIRLLPMWGPSRNAVLQVNCALGKVPDEHPADGISLTFEGGGEFDLEPSGRTMFVSTRLAASPAAKPAATGDQANPPAAPTQQ